VSIKRGEILVVDDDRINRSLLVRSLRTDGHDVTPAVDGAEALTLLASQTFDVVLLDIMMPGIDGVTVLRRIKEDHALRHVPVIMISAVEGIESVVDCIELGADDYLQKPFDPILLRARISAGMAKKQLHDLERERVRDVFGRFVPEQIVDDVISLSGDDLRLGGTLCTGSILFNDIRNFTAYAEATPADEALDVLNVLLGEMSDAILDHGGSHLGYRGDGMMAAFGAPLGLADHADRAVAAAREMLGERLPRLNVTLRDRGVTQEFRMGVGIASGTFMAGNVGSSRRLEYTAIGDVANIAARLEGMTKGTPNTVLISGETSDALLAAPGDLQFVGEAEVRGKLQPVKLWTLADVSHDRVAAEPAR
jgi:adenylate cyclase